MTVLYHKKGKALSLSPDNAHDAVYEWFPNNSYLVFTELKYDASYLRNDNHC